jgi:hypothetical protein
MHKMRKIKFLLIIFFILITQLLKAKEEIPCFWQGYIEVSQKMLAAAGSSSSGEVTTRWKLNVNWEETKKNDIKDKNGTLVGQLIKLEDNGSTWQGTVTGGFAQTSQDISYAGQGSGSNNIISYAWIYYGLSDKDPLKDILPNGSYCIGANPGSVATFKETITYIDRDRGSTRSATMPVFLNYFIGGKNLSMPFGNIKGPDLAGPVSAETIKECVTRGAQAMASIQATNSWDTEARLIKNGMMKGHYQRTAFNGTLLNEISWNISKVMDASGVIEKVDKNWRPLGGDENNSIKIKTKIKENSELKGKWKFTLFEVSKEQGYAMNKGNSTDYDLKFVENRSDFVKGSEAMTIESTKAMNSTEVEIESLDYGAWGKLKAEVNIEGAWYKCKTEDGKDYITIPFDDNENHIADKWEEKYEVTGESADSDNDNEPEGVGSNKEAGDGFTNYEEYRGFFVNGQWKDTDPKYKDLFIYDELGFGVGKFTELKLQIHLIDQNEFDSERYVNFNRGYGTLGTQNGQKGLYICGETMASSYGRASIVGSPNVVDKVYIDAMSLMSESMNPIVRSAKHLRGGARENIFHEELDTLIAHELGHAVNLMHHGIDSVDKNMCYESDISPDEVAVTGGKWSGDVKCVMLYDPPLSYLGWDNKFYDYPENEGGTSRTTFCDSKEGTGINAPPNRIGVDKKPYPVAGNATYGECRKNVTLKGNHYYGDDPRLKGLEKY